MTSTTGLFQFDPYGGEPVPAFASMATDPIGQVVAVITAWLPAGTGSSGYDWDRTAYLRVDFAREKIDLVWTVDAMFSVEGEWDLEDDEEVREYLLLVGGDVPDVDAFAVLAAQAPDLAIAPPDPGLREMWAGGAFDEGVPADDWAGPTEPE